MPADPPADPPGDDAPGRRIDPQRKRLVFIAEKLAGRSGGAERILIETANAFARRGHRVDVATHELSGEAPFYPLAPGVVLSNLRPPQRGLAVPLGRARRVAERGAPDLPGLDRLIWLSRNGGFWRRLQAYLRLSRADVAVAFMPPAITALARARVDHAMLRVASTHNVPEQDFANPLRWDPSRLDRARRVAALAQMDRIAVLLPGFADWYPAHLRDRVSVLANAVAPVDPARLAAARRAAVVLAVGRLAPVKRHDLLIAAWSAIAPRFPDWHLRILGEGPACTALEAQILRLGLAGRVHLMGSTAMIDREYLGAALLAHPAEFEGFGLAPAEALAAGLPVVAFADCPGVNDLVHDGENGVLVAPANGPGADRTAAFADALARLMGDPARRAALGAAGPASVAAFAPDAIMAGWERLLLAPDPR